MGKDFKKLENCALFFIRKKGADGKTHDNMYVQLPNGKSMQVKQSFFDKNELSALKFICGVNYYSAPVTEKEEEDELS